MNDTDKRKAVAYWLITGVIMIIIQTLLGGVTRLTGSGLSITKWHLLDGILPPLNGKQWNDAFAGYKQIGQFKYMNSDYTLADFKAIFFWEWFHRLWARTLGVVFAIGFIYFLVKKYFDREMIRPFVILFLLGGLQGAIGWIMVASGLNDSHLYVDHIKLAMHFVAAMILACYTLWFALKLLIPANERLVDTKAFDATIIIIALLFIQLTYGSFMAGLKAAMAAPTWPTINGMLLPESLRTDSLVNNKINVHFIHRTIAYLLLIFIIAWYVRVADIAKQTGAGLLRKACLFTIVLISLQVLLGIVTVISAPHIVPNKFGQFEILAECHQLVAMFLLMSLVVNLYIIRRQKAAIV